MNRHVSDKVDGGADFFINTMLLDRSLEKFREGIRTEKPITYDGKEFKSGTYLLSTYIGGEFGVITTDADQWMFKTSDLPNAKELQRSHEGSSHPFAATFDDDFKATFQDDIPTTTSRNERCPCGSGLKYKQCHGKANDDHAPPFSQN